MKVKKYGPYNWTPTSEAFYNIIKKFIKKEDKVLEFGSSTGHISYRLAKKGYNITLLEIREESIETAKNNFKKSNVMANFICGNIFDHNDKYDLLWNSGLIQCFDDTNKKALINKISTLSNNLLLFYPDVDNPNKIMGDNMNIIPGVGDAKEYDIKRVPEIVYNYFDELIYGKINKKQIGLNFDMYWLFAKKEGKYDD